MRRVVIAVLVLAGLPACMKSKKPVQYVEEGGSQLAAALNAADPRTAIQLLRGFHDVENNSWRWTASRFAVALRPPTKIPADGANLYLDYVVPAVFLEKVPETTLAITVNGKALEPEKITKAGAFKLERKVTASMLQGDVVTVDFSLDKFLAAGVVDQRELGLIVSAVGLQRQKSAAEAVPAAK